MPSPENFLSRTKPTLLVNFGRSGNSPESLGNVEAAEVVCQNLYHLFVTCNHEVLCPSWQTPVTTASPST